MRIQVYLRVVSDEATVRALDKEASIHGASVRPTKAHRKDNSGVWWSWQTTYLDIDDDVDTGVKRILTQHRPLFPLIKKHRGAETDVYLEIVTRC